MDVKIKIVDVELVVDVKFVIENKYVFVLGGRWNLVIDIGFMRFKNEVVEIEDVKL